MTQRTKISPEQTVNEVLRRYPATAAVFGRMGLDLCCGGVHPIRMAAAAHGVKEEELMAELERAIDEGSSQDSQGVAQPGQTVQGPARTLTLDVRGLEPPEPMVRILSKLGELGPGEVLVVTHFREPFPLYQRLQEGGFEHETRKLAEDRFLITIRRRGP